LITDKTAGTTSGEGENVLTLGVVSHGDGDGVEEVRGVSSEGKE
jgi:hypothetical protein